MPEQTTPSVDSALPISSHLSPALLALVADLFAGRTSVAELAHRLGLANDAASSTRLDAAATIDGATVDLGRKARCGFGEVIYGQGKSADLIGRIIATQLAAGQSSLVTRIADEAAASLGDRFGFCDHNRVARTLRVSGQSLSTTPVGADSKAHHVAVITAGSTDGPVAEEAAETLAWMGVGVDRFNDIGVAGPGRLIAAVPKLRTASAVVVVAGMEGALPSVVAGHLAVPIFAVPTSVGYGASLGGLTALMGMLSACAANVAVVNIDAGFKGGYLAGMVALLLQRAAHDARSIGGQHE